MVVLSSLTIPISRVPPGRGTCWDHALYLAVPPGEAHCTRGRVIISPVPGGNQAEGFEGGWNLAPHLPLFSGSWLLGPWVGHACWAWPPSVTCDPGSIQARYLEAPKAVTGTIMSVWGWATLRGRPLGRGGLLSRHGPVPSLPLPDLGQVLLSTIASSSS